MTENFTRPARTTHGGLQRKIVAWSFVPTAIILGMVALVIFYAYQRVTADLAIERNRELARLMAAQLSTDLEGYAGELQIVAGSFELPEIDLSTLSAADSPALQAALRWNMGRLAVFDQGVLVLDPAGQVLAADPRRLELVGQDWSARPYLGQVLESREAVVSDVLPDGVQGAGAVSLALPIVDARGEPDGAIVGLIGLSAGPETRLSAFYSGIFRRLDVRGGGAVYLLDGSGRVVYHSDTWRIGEDAAGQAVAQQALSGASTGLRTRDERGEEIVASFAAVPGTPWTLVTEESWAELTRASRGYGRLLAGLLILGAVVPVLVVAVGVRRITRPIDALIGAAREIAGGQFGRQIAVQTGDELETLAEQFNRMSVQLQASYAHLERRVADRTRELATLNAIAATVSRSLDLREILCDALDETLAAMGMEAGAAYRLVDPAGGEGGGQVLELMGQRGLSEAFVRRAARLPLWASAAAGATETQQPVVVDVSDYPESELKALVQREGLRLAVSVPLTAKGRVLGAINLGSRTLRAVTPEELSLLAAVGQQTGLAVENARLYEQAEESAVAAERNRLARDLHDAVTQTLFAASLIADVLPRLWERHPDEARRRLEELRQLARGALAEMRTLLLELRPAALVEAPLGDLLRHLAEATTGRARVPVVLALEGDPPALPVDVKVALYRIAQEALSNMAKHSGAAHATVRLRSVPPESESDRATLRVELCIEDDGRGFDPASIPPDHLGVGIMRERAEGAGAALTIDGQPGRGTRVEVAWSGPAIVPVQNEPL